MKLRFLHVFLLIFIITSFYSCYNDFLVINSDFSTPIKPDSNTVIFFHTIKASQPPKGISRFPDGGTHKIVYKNTSIFRYDINFNKLTKINDFGNLPFNSWNGYISTFENDIAYSIAPGLGWEWRVANSTKKDEFSNLNTKKGGIYLYNTKTLKNERFIKEGCNPIFSPKGEKLLYITKDTINIRILIYSISNNSKTEIFKTQLTNRLSHLLWYNEKEVFLTVNDKNYLLDSTGKVISNEYFSNNNRNVNTLTIKELKILLKDINAEDWGFKLKENWNKDIDDFCNDIVLLNGNLEYRKAILNEYKDDFSKKDIERILEGIDKRKQNLDGYKKTEYEIFSKETVDLLKRLLDEE